MQNTSPNYALGFAKVSTLDGETVSQNGPTRRPGYAVPKRPSTKPADDADVQALIQRALQANDDARDAE